MMNDNKIATFEIPFRSVLSQFIGTVLFFFLNLYSEILLDTLFFWL